MENKILKTFDTEIKGINESERSITALVSTAARDRMGEVLLPEGADLKQFKKNPVVLFGHNYSQPPIGRAMWIKKTAEGILSKVQFATTAFADEVYQLYKDGFMKAFSVGFLPKEFSDGDGKKQPRRTYSKWELVEYSAVPVPANPEALSLAISKGVLKSDLMKKEFKTYSDVEALGLEVEKGTAGAEIVELNGEQVEVGIGNSYLDKPPEEEVAVPANNIIEEVKAMQAEIEQLKQASEDQVIKLKEENAVLRYKIYAATAKQEVKQVSEMTDDDIVKTINDVAVRVIRRITGKVS